ncbi:response regulator [Allosphingosinicella deserti]|uniref:Transcriptional regulator n=1 Tax=Allosphingosinicella deserti TaxID=2116704 RepID=A0A2P7QHJ0_9SPHN|nr:response regulator [Sphingomonas deserti]PSJ37396.1 transcriptional regulator [Sphingomonas deserti]
MTIARSVLIVEDESLIAMMLEDFLDSMGHQIAGTCESVPEAMARVGEGGFDVAILDVNLKGERIWPVADRLREMGIPYILATGGHIEPPPAAHAQAPVLSKPFTIDAIEPALDEAFAG